MSDEELKHLRAEIDELDEALISVLARRYLATGKVGVIKAAQSMQAVDPVREAAQAERYSALATAHGVSSELVQKVFRVIIDDVVINHRAIRESALK